MSTVTNVIVTFELGDEDKVAAVNAFFLERDGVCLNNVGAMTFGQAGKALEAVVLVGAQNCMDHDEFIAHLQGIDWDSAEAVHLFMQKQDDEEGFHEFEVFDPPVMTAASRRAELTPPLPGARCPRCHKTAPKPTRCALCNPTGPL